MPSLKSLDRRRSIAQRDFRANADAMRALVDDLNAQLAQIAQGGGAAARDKHLARGKLLPRERVEQLLDPGTPFLEISPARRARHVRRRRARAPASSPASAASRASNA